MSGAVPARRGPSLAVDVADTEPRLDALRAEWDRLAEDAGLGHPFLTFDWTRTWWACFGGRARPHVVVVRSAGRTVAIAPLALRTRRMYGVGMRCLEAMHNDHTPRWDVLSAGGNREALDAIWDHVRTMRDAWDVLLLAQIPVASGTLDGFAARARADGFLTGIWRSSRSPYVPCASDWDAYLATRRTKHRSNLRNRAARLRRSGPVGVDVVCGGEALDSALDDGLALEAAAWKDRAGTAILSRPDTRRFYTELAARAARRGWLRLEFLTVGDRRVAFHYLLRYADALHVLKQGYDPAYAAYSPGTILTCLVLEDAFRGGDREVDLLGDTEPWKSEWTGTARDHAWLFVFPGRARSRLVHAAKFGIAPAIARLAGGRS